MPTLFVDFDGTICHDRFWRSLPPVEYTRIQEILFIQNDKMVADWMRGKYTSEQIVEFVAAKAGIEYGHLWEVFQIDCKTMRIDKQLLALLPPLRAKFHLVLITGNMDSFDRFTSPTLLLANYFDVIVNSYTERQLKTDNKGESFLQYLSGSISEAILIEDSPNSCSVFSQLGGTALSVTSDHSALQRMQIILK